MLYDRCDDRVPELIESRMLESSDLDVPFHIRVYETIIDTVLQLKELESKKYTKKVMNYINTTEGVDLIPMDVQENIR